MERIKRILTKIGNILVKIIMTVPAILVGSFMVLPSFLQKLLIIFATPTIDLWFPHRKKEVPPAIEAPKEVPPEEEYPRTFI